LVKKGGSHKKKGGKKTQAKGDTTPKVSEGATAWLNRVAEVLPFFLGSRACVRDKKA